MTTQTPESSTNLVEQTPTSGSTVFYEDETVTYVQPDEGSPSPSMYETPAAAGYGDVGTPEYGTTASAAGYGAAGTPEYGTTTGADVP